MYMKSYTAQIVRAYHVYLKGKVKRNHKTLLHRRVCNFLPFRKCP